MTINKKQKHLAYMSRWDLNLGKIVRLYNIKITLLKGVAGSQTEHGCVTFNKPEQEVNISPQLQLIGQIKQCLR